MGLQTVSRVYFGLDPSIAILGKSRESVPRFLEKRVNLHPFFGKGRDHDATRGQTRVRSLRLGGPSSFTKQGKSGGRGEGV